MCYILCSLHNTSGYCEPLQTTYSCCHSAATKHLSFKALTHYRMSYSTLPFLVRSTLGYVSLYSTSVCHCWPLKKYSKPCRAVQLWSWTILEGFLVSGYRWQLWQLNCVHNFKFGFTSKVHSNHFIWELSVTTFKWAYCNHGVLLPPHTPLCLVRWVWLGWCGRRYVNSSSVGHC